MLLGPVLVLHKVKFVDSFQLLFSRNHGKKKKQGFEKLHLMVMCPIGISSLITSEHAILGHMVFIT